MALVAVMNSAGSAALGRLLDAADDLCDVLLVNADDTPWSERDRAALDGVVDFLDGAGMGVDELCRELAQRRVDGVLTFGDELIPTTAAVAERLGLPYHDTAVAAALTHKDIQRRLLAEAGLRQPYFATFTDDAGLRDAMERVGFPAVLKPVCGNGSTNVVPVDDEEQVQAALRDAAAGTPDKAARFEGRHGFGGSARWQLEERLIGMAHPGGDWLGDYVSVETLSLSPGEHCHFWVTDRLPLVEPFREGGLGGPSLLPGSLRDEVCRLVAEGLDALGVGTGLSHSEVKLTPDGPRIIEINGRLGGMVADLVSKAGGPDVVRLALQSALGTAKPVSTQGDRLSFALLVQAPAEATSVSSLADPARLHQLPGVWRVDAHTTPGEAVDARNGILGRVQTVWVTSETSQEMRAALDGIHDILRTGNVYAFDRELSSSR
jgi:biotin carboxylase